MIFNVKTVSGWYKKEGVERLEPLGFIFNPLTGYDNCDGWFVIKEDQYCDIEINTIQELVEFMKVQGDIILDADCNLTIYDGYIE